MALNRIRAILSKKLVVSDFKRIFCVVSVCEKNGTDLMRWGIQKE